MSIALIALASFFTWICSRRRNILMSLVAGLLWFALAMWLFFSAAPPFDLSEAHSQILAWVFIVLTFVPFILYMNVPITKTKRGVTWTEYGEPPEERPSEYEKYAADLHARMYRNRRKRRLL